MSPLTALSYMTRRPAPEVKDVQDLKCGDVFLFREQYYICLSNFTDKRHTQSIITTYRENSDYKIVVLRLFRTFQVSIVAHYDQMSIEQVNNERTEITVDMVRRLEDMKAKQEHGLDNY